MQLNRDYPTAPTTATTGTLRYDDLIANTPENAESPQPSCAPSGQPSGGQSPDAPPGTPSGTPATPLYSMTEWFKPAPFTITDETVGESLLADERAFHDFRPTTEIAPWRPVEDDSTPHAPYFLPDPVKPLPRLSAENRVMRTIRATDQRISRLGRGWNRVEDQHEDDTLALQKARARFQVLWKCRIHSKIFHKSSNAQNTEVRKRRVSNWASKDQQRRNKKIGEGKLIVGHLYKQLKTALPFLRHGGAWGEVPVPQFEPTRQGGVYGLQHLGFVPSTVDASNLFSPNSTVVLPAKIHNPAKRHGANTDFALYKSPAFQVEEREEQSALKLPTVSCHPYKWTFEHRLVEALGILGQPAKGKAAQNAAAVAVARRLAADTSSIEIYRRRPDVAQVFNRPLTRSRTLWRGVKLETPPPSLRGESIITYGLAEKSLTGDEDGWTLFVRDGCLVEDSPTCVKFREVYEERWVAIRYIVSKVEQILRRYAIPWAELKCSKLLELASAIPLAPFYLTPKTLPPLLANQTDVLGLLHRPGQLFKGNPAAAPTLAAVQIQFQYRVYRQRKQFLDFLAQQAAARQVAKAWRIHAYRKSLVKAIRNRFETIHVKRFSRLLAGMLRDWPHIAARSKIVVVLGPRFGRIEIPALVLGKAVPIYEENDDCIMIVPFFDGDKREYFERSLDCAYPQRSPLSTGRLRIVSPESAKCFIPGASVASMALASPKALRQLKEMIQGRVAVLCCDTVAEPEIILSSTLNVPILGCTSDRYRFVNSRINARAFLKQAGLELAPGVISAGDERNLCNHVAKCLLLHPNVPRWNFYADRSVARMNFSRPDDLFDAHIESAHVPIDVQNKDGLLETLEKVAPEPSVEITAILPSKSPTNITEQPGFQFNPLMTAARPAALESRRRSTRKSVVFQDASAGTLAASALQTVANAVQEGIKRNLRRRGGGNYHQFSEDWCSKDKEFDGKRVTKSEGARVRPMLRLERKKRGGGLIQAVPVSDGRQMRRVDIGLMMDPRGTWQIVATSEMRFGQNFEQVGLVVPQQSLTATRLGNLINKLAWMCAGKGIIGFVTLQIAAWKETNAGYVQDWCTNFYPFLSPSVLYAVSVSLSTGIFIDRKSMETGPINTSLSFDWSTIPLHTTKSDNAWHLDKKRMREMYEGLLAKEAGGHHTTTRIAIVLFGLVHSEVRQMTARAVAVASQRRGMEFSDRTRLGSWVPLTDSRAKMSIPLISVGVNYTLAVETMLRDLIMVYRRLKYGDTPDVLTNFHVLAVYFMDDLDQHHAWVHVVPEVPLEIPVVQTTTHPGDEPASDEMNQLQRLADAVEAMHVHELDGWLSIRAAAGNFQSPEFYREHKTENDNVIVYGPEENRILQAQATSALAGVAAMGRSVTSMYRGNKSSTDLTMWQTERCATASPGNVRIDADIFHSTVGPEMELEWAVTEWGRRMPDDSFDTYESDADVFGDDSVDGGTAVTIGAHPLDLEDLIKRRLPHLVVPSALAGSRPLTPSSTIVARVQAELQTHRNPRPFTPRKAVMSSTSVKLLAEGVPSNGAARLDPTFRRPVVSPPFSQSERGRRLRAGWVAVGSAAAKRAREVIEEMEADIELEEMRKEVPASRH
ncbi:hypothetical protein DFJ73DRAFT_796244, partial [Zopfochytrium polystomum]